MLLIVRLPLFGGDFSSFEIRQMKHDVAIQRQMLGVKDREGEARSNHNKAERERERKR